MYEWTSSRKSKQMHGWVNVCKYDCLQKLCLERKRSCFLLYAAFKVTSGGDMSDYNCPQAECWDDYFYLLLKGSRA